MKRCALLAGVLALGGLLAACGVAPVREVKVPVPVECRVDTPARPAMPTEALAPGVDLDRFSASALAEIELREGYESELRAALGQCVGTLGR
ncbi:hypothetical protein QTI51_17280 [Variovorax sp. J22G73]|nr:MULTISPECIES: hypothetical protein [unclassified Variovorax]MDM0007206.1 hypothetical protein [Variovorax sp. J22R203]MDM0099042.1 hypothetical protein [Variovorax sp. J22G73]